MANTVKSLPEAIGWPEGNSRQMPVSNKKDSISYAVPLCLPNNYTWDSDTNKISVDKTKPRKTLTVCTEGLELLKSLKDQLLVVLCIAGPARSGKSFFASQLLEDVNFDVGHGAVSHTAGIWIGVGEKPVSFRSGKARVVILDAEGLGGVNTDSSNTDAKWEHKIFSLCVLLSSYVIYNSKGSPNNDELDKLGFIAEFSRSIFRERQKDVDKLQTPSEGLGQFGPDFLWLFRDNLYTPDLNGKPCDWTEFVKKALLDPKPNEPERNNIRKSISSTFRTIQAADLPPPTTDSNAVKNLLAVVNKDKISQDFFPRVKEVVQSLLSSVQVKTIKGSKLTGSQFIDMLLQVVDIVNSECDKLDVTSMWDSMVNAEMQRYIQSALDLYKEKMEQVELPEEEETYLQLHKSTKDFSEAHFKEVTNDRFDEDICPSQIQVLCDKIELEFNNSLLKKNEKASLIFNNKLITDLENEYFNYLPTKPSCMQLKTANEKLIDCYNEAAKGPKAEQVKKETQRQRDHKIDIMRTESLMYAEQLSCELFENSLKKALEGDSLTQSEVNALKKTCTDDCFNVLRKASCNDGDCTPCMKFEHSLGKKVESIFTSCSSECYDKSDKACQCLIKELIQTKLLPFVMKIDSYNYSDFLKLKDDILTRYDREAKGPAKRDLVGTCTKTIDMQKEGIQLLIMQSALKSVTCEYTNILNQTAKSDPCEAEELDKMQVLKHRDMISAFEVKCEGIDESELEPYHLNLENLIKNFSTWIAHENTLRSINICEELVTRLSREFHDGILQTYIPEILRETEYSQCSHHLQMAEEFKQKIINDFEQQARGPEKVRFKQSLNKYIEIHLIIFKKVVNEMVLKTALVKHFAQLNEIKKKYPMSETELETAISKTNENTKKEFIDSQKPISLPFVSCSKDILLIILNLDTIQLVEGNYKKSMSLLDNICKQISSESREKCEKLVKGRKADTVEFAKIRDCCTKEFEERGKGALKDHYKNILKDDIDMELRFAHTTLADNRVKRIFADCRNDIENLVQSDPREQDALENDIKRVEEDARQMIGNLQNEIAEANITGTEEMLTIELKDVRGKNLRISFEKCSAQLREVLEELKGDCKTFLASETSAIDGLLDFKDKYLRQYDQAAIGPAKVDVREALEQKIVEEVDKTFVLFAKAKFQIILRKEIRTHLLNKPKPDRDNQLFKFLMTKADDILKTYSKLGSTTTKDLKEELEKSVNPSLLNELTTAYAKEITQLGNGVILEGDKLEKEIESAKNGLCEILGINGALPEETKKEMDNAVTSFKKENLARSRIDCQKTLNLLFQYNWDYLTKEHFKKTYDEQCKGPARKMVWNEKNKKIDIYYESRIALWRKVKAPVKYFLFTES